MSGQNLFTVFTKPWRTQTLEELCQKVKSMGFDGVEYAYRPGYQVQPEDGAAGLRRLKDTLDSFDLKIGSIAAGLDVRVSNEGSKVSGMTEDIFAGCAENGIPVIRICQGYDDGLGFYPAVEQIQRKYDALLPFCEKYGVTVGVQMHYGNCIANSAETMLLLQKYDPRYIAAVWDSGHSGLAGTVPSIGLDIVWNNLCMVNFKAAYFRNMAGPEAEEARFEAYWTTGRHGCGSWKEAVDYLKAHHYTGTVCLPAEYSDEARVESYAAEDLQYLRSLFGR